MTSRSRGWAATLGVGLLALLAACAGEAPGSISPEAQAALAEGDARAAEAARLEAEAEALEAGEAPPENGVRYRSLQDAAEPPEDRAAAARAEAARLREAAEDAWERAVAIDADAQDAVLQRLRGSVPQS